MITLKNITKNYWHEGQSVQALNEINLTIPNGKIFGIMGRSGAGKTTLVRIMNLLESPSSGEISIDGDDLHTLSAKALRAKRRKIGMVFQHFNLLSSRNVFDNIALPLEMIHAPRTKILEKVNNLLELVNLTDRKNHFPDQLSGGQKQRVAIARALACNPQVLLCDEATSALDPQATQNILSLLAKINETYQLTIVLITHELEVIKRLCHHVAILDKAKLIESGTTLDIFTKPQHETTKSLTRAALQANLPDRFREHCFQTPVPGSHIVIQLTFINEQIEEPLLAHLSEKFSIETNIIQAHIDWIQDTAVGITTCELLGDVETCQAVLTYLKTQTIQFEVIGYVNSII
jgi:D-methionine transport system ATP-binding protein